MDSRTALSRVLPLLLLLLSSPQGGCSLPLSSPDNLEPSAVQPSQELVEGLPVTVSELQGEPLTQKPLQQDRRSTEAWEAKQKDFAGADEPQTFQELQGKTKTSCFGAKIDRIHAKSRLGCNVVKPKKDVKRRGISK